MQFGDQFALLGRFSRGQGRFNLAQLGIAVQDKLNRRHSQRWRLLGNVGNHPTGRHVQITGFQLHFTAQQGK